MQLKVVSAFGHDLKTVYRQMINNPQRKIVGRMMLQLLEHLETQVDTMGCWAYIHADELVLTDIDTPLGGRRVYIGVLPDTSGIGADEYEVTYFVDPPWWSVKGYARDVFVAGNMITQALERTVCRND